MKTDNGKKKILNPYVGMDGYNCFACSPDNAMGLKMDFFEDGEFVVCHWIPEDQFGGYKKVLHGGIQATLMDEIASWAVQIKLKTAGVTASLKMRYKKPVYTTDDVIIVKSIIKKWEKRIAIIQTQIFNSENELCSEAEVKYFVFPEEVARAKLYYPEYEKFLKK